MKEYLTDTRKFHSLVIGDEWL